jgi:two-component system, NarL family, sensor histidine kinase UhpB
MGTAAIRSSGAGPGGSVEMSLFRRVFLPNAVVLLVASFVLVLSPATISSPVAAHEVVTLLSGLAAMLLVNVALMRRAFAPLGRLTEVMRRVDPLEPGRRIEAASNVAEVNALTGAFNEMLDRVEHERRDSALRSLSSQEADRRRFARELHDELGQVLTALGLQLERAAREAPEDAARELREARATAGSALEEVRRIVRELRPEALDDLGLVSSLAALATSFSRWAGMEVDLELDRDAPGLDPDAELVFYRVAQESLTNAARHSGSDRVSVRLDGVRGRHRMSIRDRGAGAPQAAFEGSGIRGMRERALAIGADLSIRSAPGRGTEIVLSLEQGPQ